MSSLRSTVKILVLIFYTTTSYSLFWTVYIFFRLFRIPHYGLKNLYMKTWAKVVCLVLNIHVTTKGNPPKPPFFLVSNHLSYLDIIPMYLSMNCTFVAKKEVRNWPVLGYMVYTMGVIFIDRTRKRDVTRVNDTYKNHLNHYQGIVIFPEGTTSGGDGILPFRASLLEYPAIHDFPVHYASLSYKTHPKDLPASESVCWFGAQSPFANHVINMAKNRRIECTIQFGNEAIHRTNRKELSSQLHKKIEDQFTPTMEKNRQSDLT